MNKYCMCILNQKKKESIGFVPTPKSVLKSVGLDSDSAELALRKVKEVAIPVVSAGVVLFVGAKAVKHFKGKSRV